MASGGVEDVLCEDGIAGQVLGAEKFSGEVNRADGTWLVHEASVARRADERESESFARSRECSLDRCHFAITLSMADSVINVRIAKAQFAQLIARAEKGERITIARAGRPVAELGPVPKAARRQLPPDDPILNLDKFGFDGPGANLTNGEIDRVVYRP
jgi:prevent-host-death family protein